MSQLTFGSIPGFFDLGDAAIAGDQPLTDDSIQKISHNAKFAAVRPEPINMGWYKHGNIIPLPVSPVDGYAYSQAECRFMIVGWCTRLPAPGFVPGQANPPVMASSNSGAGNHFWHYFYIARATRTVTLTVSYYVQGGAETATNDGMVEIEARCVRESVDN